MSTGGAEPLSSWGGWSPCPAKGMGVEPLSSWGGGASLGLLDLIRGADGSGSRKQRNRGGCFNQGGVEDDWQRHGGHAHLQGGRQGLQDEGRLAGGRGTLVGGSWPGGTGTGKRG